MIRTKDRTIREKHKNKALRAKFSREGRVHDRCHHPPLVFTLSHLKKKHGSHNVMRIIKRKPGSVCGGGRIEKVTRGRGSSVSHPQPLLSCLTPSSFSCVFVCFLSLLLNLSLLFLFFLYYSIFYVM